MVTSYRSMYYTVILFLMTTALASCGSSSTSTTLSLEPLFGTWNIDFLNGQSVSSQGWTVKFDERQITLDFPNSNCMEVVDYISDGVAPGGGPSEIIGEIHGPFCNIAIPLYENLLQPPSPTDTLSGTVEVFDDGNQLTLILQGNIQGANQSLEIIASR